MAENQYCLRSTNGSSATLSSDDYNYRIIFKNELGAEFEFVLEGLPELEFEAPTETRIFAQTDLALLSIVLNSETFDVCVRSLDESFVGVKTSLSNDSWYGLGHFMRQRWPLEKLSIDFGPFYTFDVGCTGLCTQIDPTLISSSGLFFKVDDTSPCLHLGFNSGEPIFRDDRNWTAALDPIKNFLPLLKKDVTQVNDCIEVQSRKTFDWPHVAHPWWDKERKIDSYPLGPELRFQVGFGRNTREACDIGLRKLVESLGPRKSIPSSKVMQYPIWTTWARYGPDINQDKVLEFANEIVARNLPRSVIEIDDKWSPKYGEIEFDKTKFPNPRLMVDMLHKLGFQVTLWVMPFAQEDSKSVLSEETKQYYMQNEDGEVGFFRWWQPFLAAGLDVMNEDACDWFVSCLQKLQNDYGIDGFKFDAGEAYFIPPNSKIAKRCRVPSEYTRKYIENIASRFQVSEVRAVVQGCQQISPMVRMLDRYSTWDFDNGLASVITATLTNSILGYPFSLPDMIGGNAYGDQKPNSELMIRWAQLTSALPTMQFSLAPWDYGKSCDDKCQLTLAWRSKIFWKRIEPLLKSGGDTYTPIIRPMWWIDESPMMSKIEDQFLIGNDLLIAPIIEKGGNGRVVSFPEGKWLRVQLPGVQNIHQACIFNGGMSTYVEAQLEDMPVFQRI